MAGANVPEMVVPAGQVRAVLRWSEFL